MTSEKQRRSGGEPERSKDQAGQLIDTNDSTRPVTHDALEAAAIEALIGGDPYATIDAYEDGLLDPAMFRHRRPVVEATIAMIEDGRPPWPQGDLYRELLDRGVPDAEARELILNPGGFEAAGFRFGALVNRIAALNAYDQRQELRVRLSGLADALDRPGGIVRVRRILEGGEAA